MNRDPPVIRVFDDPSIDVPNLQPQLILNFTLGEYDQVLVIIDELLVRIVLWILLP